MAKWGAEFIPYSRIGAAKDESGILKISIVFVTEETDEDKIEEIATEMVAKVWSGAELWDLTELT